MKAARHQFQCPHCAQRLEIEGPLEGHVVRCPICDGEVWLERKVAATGTSDASWMHPVIGNLLRLAFAAPIGAVIAYALTWNSWLTLVGALVGGLYGQRRIRQTTRRLANDPRWQRQEALAGLRSATVSWLLLTALWSWVLTRPPEEFHDQGGMLLTYLVYPTSLVLWILGGPVALARGGTNRWSVLTPADERWALCGLVLSGLLILAPFAAFFLIR